MSNDLIVICLVIAFGSVLSYFGLLASQRVERKHELQRARIDARRYGRRALI